MGISLRRINGDFYGVLYGDFAVDFVRGLFCLGILVGDSVGDFEWRFKMGI